MRNRIDTERLVIELKRSVKPLFLFVLLIACGITGAITIFRNQTFQRPWKDYYEVRAAFDDVKGVTPPTQQVRIGGVKVGVIKDVDLVHGRPVVTLSIEKKYGRLYRDARLRLRPSTPLQDMYVAVERRGTRRAGVLGEHEILRAEQTETPVDIASVMNTFDAPTRQRLSSLLDGLGRGLEDRGQSLRAAFAQTVPFLDMAKHATEVVARRRAATRHIVRNLGELTEVLAKRNRQLTGLVAGGESTLGELTRHDRNLAATLGELPVTLSSLRSALGSLRAAEGELDPTLRSLNPVLTRLDSGLDALARFGREARPALSALRAPVRRLAPLARDLDPAARALQPAMAQLAKQAPKYDRITALLPPCLERLAAFMANSVSMTKFSDARGVVPRAETTWSLDSASQVADGPKEPGMERKPSCITGGKPQ